LNKIKVINNMKKLAYLMSLLTTALFVSCEKEEKSTIDTQTVRTINSEVSTSEIVLLKANAANEALTISWDTPDVGVKTVFDYELSFNYGENAKTILLKEPKKEFTVEEFNLICNGLKMPIEQANTLSFTVKALIGAKSLLIASSEAKTIKATPYKAIIEYPSFYLVGNASYVGWNESKAQLLYKKDNLSTIYTYLKNGEAFRFLGQKDWGPTNYSMDADNVKQDYKYFKTVSSNLTKADGNDAENMVFSGTTGIYKIEINAKEEVKSLNVTPSSLGYQYENLYLIGSITNKWDLNSIITMTKVSEGVFEHTIALPDGAEFKFLGQKSWDKLDWGDISSEGNTGFIAPKGDNNNLKYNGGGSTYKITVNLKAGIYSIEKQ
jgi:hypothetical protein